MKWNVTKCISGMKENDQLFIQSPSLPACEAITTCI